MKISSRNVDIFNSPRLRIMTLQLTPIKGCLKMFVRNILEDILTHPKNVGIQWNIAMFVNLSILT